MDRDKLRARIEKSVKDAVKSMEQPTRKGASKPTEENERKQVSMAKYLRGALHNYWEDADIEKRRYAEVNKSTLTSSDGSLGGFFVPPEQSNEIIELLRAKAVIRGMGPTVYPMNSDTLDFGRQDSAATAYWAASDDTLTASNPEMGLSELKLKELTGLVKIKDNLIYDASPAVDTLVRSDLVKVLGLAEDLAFVEGTGGVQPLGTFNYPNVQSTTIAGNVSYDDLIAAETAIEAENGSPTAWLMHPRVKGAIKKIKNAEGDYIWTDGDVANGEPPTLLGYPVYMSTQIATDANDTSGALDESGSSSYIILADWTDYAIGEKAGQMLRIEASREANTAFESNETWIKACMRVDAIPRHPKLFYVLKAVTY